MLFIGLVGIAQIIVFLAREIRAFAAVFMVFLNAAVVQRATAFLEMRWFALQIVATTAVVAEAVAVGTN